MKLNRPKDRNVSKVVKYCSGHVKMCKSVENQKSINFTFLILSFYAEYRRNKKEKCSKAKFVKTFEKAYY